jgi:RHS repeat-associated protein
MPVVNYLWNPLNDNIVREFDDSGTVIAEYTTEANQFGNVVSQRRNGQDSVYHYDGLGSTLALTDVNGSIMDTYSYAAFGEVTAQAGNTVNPFQYIGQKGYYIDEETGEHDVRRRAMNTEISRWMALDPITLDRQFPNAYAYSYNSPINAIDSAGLWPTLCPPGLNHLFGVLPFPCLDFPDRPCLCCESAVAQLPKKWKYDWVERSGARVSSCTAKYKCTPGRCAGGNVGLTSPPIETPPGSSNWTVDICISCDVFPLSLKPVIEHEHEHRLDFCKRHQGFSSCIECTNGERTGYNTSCNQVFAPGAKRDRCKKCGLFYGCGSYLKPNKKDPCVLDEKPPCSPSDLGVILMPDK